MKLDLNLKALNLLECIANSVHERDPKNPNPLFFSIHEVKAAQEWLKEFSEELVEDCICV